MRKVTITKISVGSFARVVGVAQATIALVVGLVATILVAAGTISESSSLVRSLGVSIVWFGMGVVLYPLVMFFVGWVQGAIAALILNLFFAEAGGLRLHLEDEK
jgi:hypothetical protein